MAGLVLLFLSAPPSPGFQETVKAFCRKAALPSFSPVRTLPLCRPSDFSPVALAWELKSPDGHFAWAITDLSGKTLFELGFSRPFWQRTDLKERLLTRFGSFLSDGTWHFLYRGLGGYGLAVKKGMTVRVDARTFDPWGDGKDDAAFSLPRPPFPPPSSDRLFVSFGFPLLPTLRSTHATACAMWARGRGVVSEKEPFQTLIGSLSGLITRCLCDLPEKPFVHEIERGLPLFLRLQGKSGKVTSFLFSQTSWSTPKNTLQRQKVALVTFLYRREQREREKALWRVEGTTVLAIGFWESRHGIFLLALSPSFPSDPPCFVSSFLDGVTLFRLDGPAVNLVFTFPTF